MNDSRQRLSVSNYVDGVLNCDRALLAQAITLIESLNDDHRATADAVLNELLIQKQDSIRIGITGVPGVGKSTFIESFGKQLTSLDHKVAVLAVDPTSSRTGGSILGDKTRMQELSRDKNAFIRPSPTSGTLGGVTRVTRETIVLCEAAGFDVILVETVGVGQSEIMVSQMVDFFLALMLPGAGDELQGIKKGILEIADMIAVNKADGEMKNAANRAVMEYQHALDILNPKSANWKPRSLSCSAFTGDGLAAIWETICDYKRLLKDAGEWQEKRKSQQVEWMWAIIRERILSKIETNEKVQSLVPQLELQVAESKLTPALAALEILTVVGNE
ncbi:MAG: methylmalonyl Co-A mutase-associated GTPase MeaB [Rhodospirillaceae bacterium]|nr:methylmalonyl Co-A mutase-associated GTPase MeaB [Rhodospirillaceae bacterium]OUU25670.1 MAG: methylmalonyl Co-A mutase-associated GTPase MeaB [Candidatus Endolissoclinum sp. TMED37]|tara:strand:- start:801 stop:1796 length:996 start_codon:yes stop_codon:yes gene_type:complete